MKHKNTKKQQTITIGIRNISKDGICIQQLKKLECDNYKKIFEKHVVEKECKLTYNKKLSNYYLSVVEDTESIIVNNRKEIVALDPGEKIFLSYYSVNEIGNLGKNMRDKILSFRKKIIKYHKQLKNKTYKKIKIPNKNYKNIKNKIKKRISKCYKRIEGYVNEIHKKSALYLCKNYKNIILPTFETKPMISKKQKEAEIENIKKLDKNKGKEELKKLGNKLRISKSVKFVLQMQSHYKFKRYLKAKAMRYGTKVYDVDESYTSKMCTKCGMLSDNYDKEREKQCTCGYKINRDVNGSRNILLKTIKEIKNQQKSLIL